MEEELQRLKELDEFEKYLKDNNIIYPSSLNQYAQMYREWLKETGKEKEQK